MLTVVGILVEMYSNDMATFQVEKEQKFVPYVWTVTVSCASWMKNDSTTVLNVFSFPYSSSVGLFFLWFSEVAQRIHLVGSPKVLRDQ